MYIFEQKLHLEKLLKRYQNDFFAGYFGIEKITELIKRS